MPEIWPGKCSSCKKMALDFPSHSGPDQRKPTVHQALTLWTTPIHAYEMNVMAELVYTQPLFSILFSTISFLWDASTSLVFWGKAGPCPSSWLLLLFSWQTVPRVSIEEAGKDTTHSEFVKDLIYHQSEGFQILQLCFLMLLSLWWGIKNSSQGYRRWRCLAEGTKWCPEAVH